MIDLSVEPYTGWNDVQLTCISPSEVELTSAINSGWNSASLTILSDSPAFTLDLSRDVTLLTEQIFLGLKGDKGDAGIDGTLIQELDFDALVAASLMQ